MLVDGRGNRYTFQYDVASREVVQVDPLSRRTTAAYDAASQRVLRIDARGYRTTYVWDNGGRMIGRRYPDGSRVTMAFDGVANRTKLHDSTGRYTTVWDSLNRERSVKNPAAKTITYSYDAASRRRLMVEPEGGRFTYGYLDDGMIRHLENPQNQRTTWSYDAAAQPLVQRLANGTRASYAYDDGGRMLRLANLKSDGTTLSSFRDAWDAAGNRTSRIEGDSVRVTWRYDATYQLTRERRSGANSYDITYTYDASSNRRLKLEDGIRTTYTCDVANQLVKFQDNTGTTTLTWDGNGNQQTEQVPGGGITTNTWEFENRLTRVVLPTGARNTFAYDAGNRRMQAQTSFGTTKYIWSRHNLLAETDASDQVHTLFTYAPAAIGEIVATRLNGVTSHLHGDPSGSVVSVSDGTGDLTRTYTYSAFGQVISTSGTGTPDVRYAGKFGYKYDVDLAAYYVRNRYYASRLGRWYSHDPLGFSDGPNLYSYVANAPTVYIDPHGQAFWVSFIIIFVVVAGLPQVAGVPAQGENLAPHIAAQQEENLVVGATAVGAVLAGGTIALPGQSIALPGQAGAAGGLSGSLCHLAGTGIVIGGCIEVCRMMRKDRRRWSCKGKCALVNRSKQHTCTHSFTDVVEGWGNSYQMACQNAKAGAMDPASNPDPANCQTKHCKCFKCKTK